MSLRKVLLAVLALLVLAAAWVRLAPADPARWHVDVTSDAPPLCAAGIERGAASARAACLFPDPYAAALARLDDTAVGTTSIVRPAGGPEDAGAAVLAGLDANATGMARTRRIAGTPEEGRITWETRSLLIGYPDYTTAQVSQVTGGTRLDILARSRFGAGDWGVNAARLRALLDGLPPAEGRVERIILRPEP
jgi:hypothetical protein